MDPYQNDPFQRDEEFPENGYPYRDYYSTGSDYRPPRRPRNYGFLIAVAAMLFLVVSGFITVRRLTTEPEAETLQEIEEVVSEQVDETVTPEPMVNTVPVLGSGQQLTISETGNEELRLQDIYKKTIPSVVSIINQSSAGTSTGTGIVMSADGYIITNYHVAASSQKITVLLHSEEEYPAQVVGGDETSDLMVLKIEAQGLTPAEFGNSEIAEVGDSVVAIGDPLGIELRGTMTDGIICGLYRDIQVSDRTMTLMQHNAALNSGNSGGPLVNMQGQVIGINTMKMTSAYNSVEGLGFAIPISTAKPILDELLEKGYVTGRPAFGFSVEELGARVMLYYSLPGRLYIRSVEPTSDAYLQGIRSGDIITAIEGVKVGTLDEFNLVKNEFVAGDSVSLTIFREGQELTVQVELMDRADLY